MRGRRRHKSKAREWLRRARARAAHELAEHRRNVVFFLIGAAMCFTVGPLLRYCREHRYFAVRAVEVQGQRRLDAAQVRVWLGMVEGSSIWAASPRDLEARLEAQPVIAHATVQRILPDRLRVVVREREPRAVLRHGGEAYLVDRAGVVIGRSGLLAAGLPIITLVASPKADDGSAGEAMPEMRELRQAVAVARLLEDGAAGVPISELALTPAQPPRRPELVAYSNDGRLTIRLGWGDWLGKLSAVQRILAHASAHTASGPQGAAHGATAGASLAMEHPSGTLDARDPHNVVARWALAGAI